MKKAGRQSGGQQKRRPRVYTVLGSETGASLVAAILFFVLCGVGASVILAAASASAGKMQRVPETDQKRFAVESVFRQNGIGSCPEYDRCLRGGAVPYPAAG